MNKRITSLLLCFVMIFSLLFTAFPVYAVPGKTTTLTVRPDKATASPGETVTYTVTLGAVEDLLGIKFKLIIPEGLTFVTGAAKTGVKEALGATSAEFTPSTKVFLADPEYTSASDLDLMTFECTVDSEASGNLTVQLYIDDPDNYYDSDGDNIDVQVTNATITVTVPHTHVYDQETLNFLVSAATCTSPAVYHKSCACGAEGTETFTYGSALGHDYTQKFEDAAHLKTAATKCTEHNIYWYDCSRCDSNAKNDTGATDKYFTSATTGSHSFTEQIEDAAHYVAGTGTNCQSVKKYYYDCAYCEQMGTTTWDSTTYGPHNYADVWSSDDDGHWHECSLCHGKKDEATHTPGAAATETTPQKCTVCEYVITPALGHTHHMTPVAANPATCTTDGNKAYYVCSGCSKWYEDATGSVEITDHNSVVLGRLGHDFAPATCTTPKTCSRCDATEGTALGHDFADVWSSNASGHWHACSRCDAKADEATHTPDREAATETYPIKCTECDYIITPALGHTHSLTKVEANAPTCTEDGNKAYYVCSGCNKLFADATGNVEITADKTVDKAIGHQYVWVIDKEATATEKGSKHEECKVCGYKKAAVEIPATGTPTDPTKPENPFVDVPADAYYYDAVLWAAEKGITGGVDDTHFAPNGVCTRAQAVTFLWRAAGSPAPKSSEMPFTDVAAGSYYHDAVLWAIEQGITVGTSATTFTPNADCTRAQIVTFLWRSQKSPAAGSVNPFTDVAADAYYFSAVLWAVENGITGGTTATTFSPNADCTRAQIVAFLFRCLGK